MENHKDLSDDVQKPMPSYAFDDEAHQPTTKIPDRQKLAAISPICENSEEAIEENYLKIVISLVIGLL